MQTREWHLPNWLKAENVAVPRDNIPLSGYSNLASLAVSDEMACPDAATP